MTNQIRRQTAGVIAEIEAERLRQIRAERFYVSGLHPSPKGRIYVNASEAFHELWDSLNAKRAPWSANPWVWVVEFERDT